MVCPVFSDSVHPNIWLTESSELAEATGGCMRLQLCSLLQVNTADRTVLVNIEGGRLAPGRYITITILLTACTTSGLFNHARWEKINTLPGTWYREASATTPTWDRMGRLMESRNISFRFFYKQNSSSKVRPEESEWTGRDRPCPPQSPGHDSQAS